MQIITKRPTRMPGFRLGDVFQGVLPDFCSDYFEPIDFSGLIEQVFLKHGRPQ